MKPIVRTSLAATCLAAFASFNPLSAQTDVATAAALQTAINSGDTDIVLTAPIAVTTPIFIGTTSSPTLTINGNGNSLTGTSEVFFVQSGNVTIENTTLTGTAVGGNGGVAGQGGAGALGAGGAIFVGSTANVTASNVQFSNNSATGGNGGVSGLFEVGGGGGMNGGNGGASGSSAGGGGGGNGGAGGLGSTSGGGGGGLGALNPGLPGSSTGGTGGGPNAGVGGTTGNDGGPAGANSGGGGGGNGASGGAGGTNGGGGGSGLGGIVGGQGGSYAGGGGGSTNGGNGGFGGGGGGGVSNGGSGGFGAGGGGGENSGGTAGAGGGNGSTSGPAQGGGGAGLGGAVFVQTGGSFVISGTGTFSGGSVTAGTGSNPGAAVGSDLFVMTGATTTLAPGTGHSIVVNGTIADDSINSLVNGDFYNPGTGAGAALAIGSAGSAGGTVTLNSANTYSGGTSVTHGATLGAGTSAALGSGAVSVTGGTLTTANSNNTIIVGRYTQGTGGTLLLNVNGAGTAATPDQLLVNTTAALAGTLTINFSNFTLPGGTPHTFDLTVLEAGTLTGTFTSLDALDLHGAHATLDYTTPDEVELVITLGAAVTGIPITGLTPNQQAPLGAINTAVARGNTSPSLAALSAAFAALSGPAAIGAAADQLSPLKFGNFASVTAFNNESFEVQAMDTYLASQRNGSHGTFLGGNGQLDTSELVLNDPNVDPGLQMIHSRMLAWNAPASAVTDVPGALLGGVDMKDMKSCQACNEPCNPWNFFVRGNVVLAQGLSQADQPHFDDNSESVVIGADYRFTPHFLVGVTAAYAHTDATLDTANSSATVDSYSPGIYASYADKGWYANFIGRYSYNTYTEQREISFLGQSANGSPTGNEGMADLDGGYDFHSGAWTFGPVAGLQYTHLSVNSYTENDSVADLNVDEDQSDSLRSRLGGTVKFDFRGCGVSFSPHLTASWQHEFLDESRGITSQFSDFGGGSFAVRTQNPSDDSALVDAGLDATIDKTITVFGDYMVQAGQDDYFGQSVQAGVRVNF